MVLRQQGLFKAERQTLKLLTMMLYTWYWNLKKPKNYKMNSLKGRSSLNVQLVVWFRQIKEVRQKHKQERDKKGTEP